MTTANPNPQYDLIITGGGLVGASLACALGEQGLRIAVIEAVPFRSGTQPSYDDRAIALSYGSQRVFESIGVWPSLESAATPIKHIHVSEQGGFGITRIHHYEEKVEALGYIIPARNIGRALIDSLNRFDNIAVISPAKLVKLDITEERANATVVHDNRHETLSAKLIVAADGGDSAARRLAGIEVKKVDYRQSAVIANVSTAFFHDYVAYERFTPQGPLALLPMADRRCALVWTHDNANVKSILSLDDGEFLRRLQSAFGNRLGRFTKVGKRAAYPLHLLHAREQVKPRLALIGNAAHTLHPIAGQGFNLGVRDVAVLAQTVVDAHRAGEDIGALEQLEQYARWRRDDHKHIIGFTDGLVKVFSNRFGPLRLARIAGLFAMDTVPPAKHLLSKHTMGMAGKLPRLARGLGL